ncbi:DNA-damage-inducible protein D [Mycobacteroides abscessus subsp. massiliense]|uniref:phage antirepressor KilAC domain-containing protein n=1 Tax=Mycobacteroides abscessus TaxID=36809 RepID=UPI0009A6A551|nr:phage antirepressor KilAC domain-containing protein [Mycobacteroides abscessus]SKD92876.1 DNA-damage-inducible protein D [Mycobacteroides abscessus subsp. massiliense]SKE05536.1 DNA-damage-inducible protein D [Mycobacteroides abscessus subsp. massiliense]SKE07354.1 DNA-damage-inducible protein D [Mycobacteroides abscessus subsp. massiliense]SKE59218.1 DNA-damage-inducible protein D [Mycobacteroides abscessus subsp. massiliense]SKE60425.1 DNA-damage-inducible protein D [Mycobacteroides absce
MNSELAPDVGSPFDAGRMPCPQGGEDRWSARWLMERMGYDKWERFEGVVERAKTAAHNQGFNVRTLFTVISKKAGPEVFPGSGKNLGGRPQTDYLVTRFAAYLIAMNGDPRKPDVAAAQEYFVVKTREAEVAQPVEMTEDQIVHRALHILDSKVKELAPKAEAYDHFIEATGKYSVGAVAKMLGTSQNKLYRELRNIGVLIAKGSMRNTPYQQYMHHFEVKAHEYERNSGEMGCSYTTYVQPSGIDFIRRKLNRRSIGPTPFGGVA